MNIPKISQKYFLKASQLRKLPDRPWFFAKDDAFGYKLQKSKSNKIVVFHERQAQADLQIEVFLFSSPFGLSSLSFSKQGLCGLGFPSSQAEARRKAERDWPTSSVQMHYQAHRPGSKLWKVSQGILKLMEGEALSCPLSLHFIGTTFQMLVWDLLLRLPRGCVTSYGELARAIGRPGSARAVGGAVAKNPVSFLAACHRILPADQSVGGYHWGRSKKLALLESEGLDICIDPENS